jgi:RNA recognition motif-containing protein
MNADARVAMRAPLTTGKRLYVGNLTQSVTEADLEEAFAVIGVIVESARVVRNRSTGQSRGFGFVELTSASEARRTIARLGRMRRIGTGLKVDQAREAKVLRA